MRACVRESDGPHRYRGRGFDAKIKEKGISQVRCAHARARACVRVLAGACACAPARVLARVCV
jgi:hypothetical protein